MVDDIPASINHRLCQKYKIIHRLLPNSLSSKDKQFLAQYQSLYNQMDKSSNLVTSILLHNVEYHQYKNCPHLKSNWLLNERECQKSKYLTTIEGANNNLDIFLVYFSISSFFIFFYNLSANDYLQCSPGRQNEDVKVQVLDVASK